MTDDGTPIGQVHRRDRQAGFRGAVGRMAGKAAWGIAEFAFEGVLELIAWLVFAALAALVHLV